jgi:YaiO family outer membrane protein
MRLTLLGAVAVALLARTLWAQQPEPGAPAPPLELEAAAGYEHLTAGLPAWRTGSLGIEAPGRSWGSAYGTVLATDRFALRDVQLLAGVAFRLGPRWVVTPEASASPTHEVLPTWSLGVDAARVLSGGWVLHGGLTRTDYTTVGTTLGTATVERYWGNYRAAYTAYLAKLEGQALALSNRLAVDRYYGADQQSRLGLSLALGREIEAQGPEVVTLATRAVGVSVRHWLNPAWAITADVTWTSEGDAYNRIGTRAGLRRRL